ncbi:MAG TPA: hypothetical protein PJ988_15930, partial [Anaerolinea sp.]|nr:hypothetical protein [Anaerolinea sp.]
MRNSLTLRILMGLVLVTGLVLSTGPGGALAAGLQQADQISVAVDKSDKAGMPGSSVVYNFTITNNGATNETVTIAADQSALGSVSAPGSTAVAAGGNSSIQVAVNIAST